MTLPTKGNLPIQQRAGNNQGPQALTLAQARFLGQPAVKCGVGDTVIFRNSPVVPGEENPRAVGMYPGSISGIIFNGTGGAISYAVVLFDDQGNEFIAVPAHAMAPNPYEPLLLTAITNEIGWFCLPVGWSLAVRVTAGNPTAGKGLVALPWAYDMARNLVSILQPVTPSGLVVGPPKGRAWQLSGNIIGTFTGSRTAMYLNFDNIERQVVEEILILAGEEFVTNSFGGPITVATGESEPAWEDLTENKAQGLIISYPDKIKMVAREVQSSAPLYVNINFAEFDLPRDQG